MIGRCFPVDQLGRDLKWLTMFKPTTAKWFQEHGSGRALGQAHPSQADNCSRRVSKELSSPSTHTSPAQQCAAAAFTQEYHTPTIPCQPQDCERQSREESECLGRNIAKVGWFCFIYLLNIHKKTNLLFFPPKFFKGIKGGLEVFLFLISGVWQTCKSCIMLCRVSGLGFILVSD